MLGCPPIPTTHFSKEEGSPIPPRLVPPDRGRVRGVEPVVYGTVEAFNPMRLRHQKNYHVVFSLFFCFTLPPTIGPSATPCPDLLAPRQRIILASTLIYGLTSLTIFGAVGAVTLKSSQLNLKSNYLNHNHFFSDLLPFFWG